MELLSDIQQHLVEWRVLLESLAFFSAFVTLFVLSYQIWSAKRAFRRDLYLRRQQKTFEFYDALQDEIVAKDQGIQTYFGLPLGVPLDPEQARFIFENNELRSDARFVLRKMERLAAGVKSGVYDFDTIITIGRQYTQSLFAFYWNYIVIARGRTDSLLRA